MSDCSSSKKARSRTVRWSICRIICDRETCWWSMTRPRCRPRCRRGTARTIQVEIRLTTQLDERVWQAAVFGAGDWRTPTEDRPSPPRFEKGEEISIAPDFRARVRGEDQLSGRLLDLEFNLSGEELWRSLYRHGKPVQYSYLNDELKLWSVQNVYSSRPWAVEMPSAGHALNWRLLLKLIRKGVQIVPLTHGAGLSSTGDVKIDQALAARRKIRDSPGHDGSRQANQSRRRSRHRGRHVGRPRPRKREPRSEWIYQPEARSRV